MQRKILWKIIVISIATTATSITAAEDETGRWTGKFALGYQHWSAAGDLDTEPLGRFDAGGWNAFGSIERRWRKAGSGDLLLGMDLGFMSNDSNVTAPGDIGELAADVFFLTPSLTWSVGGRRSKRVNLEAGAAAGTQHFDKIAPGGYLGISVDLPWPSRDKAWAINLGARVHYADFGTVHAFGNDLGDLDGPITTLRVGLGYDW